MTASPTAPPTELLTRILTAIVGALGGALGGSGVWSVWKWLSERSKAHADAAPAMQQATASLAAVVNDAAEMMFRELRGEMDQLRARVDQLETENADYRAQNRQAFRRIDDLEAMLRAAGIAVPDRTPATASIKRARSSTPPRTPPTAQARRP